MHLSSLYRFPLKSAAGESLQRCASDSLGLLGDRRWMVVAAGTGRFLTQRVLPRMAAAGALARRYGVEAGGARHAGAAGASTG